MGIGRKLKEELISLTLAMLYFGSWIASLMLVKWLILAEYHLAFYQWSMALVCALVLAKVVLILQHVSLGSWVRSKPAWVDLTLRTTMYSLGVAVVLILEKGFEARHEFGGFARAVYGLFSQTDFYHVLANILCLSGALLLYNILSVVDQNIGLRALLGFFASPLPDRPAEP
jgi:hypothetical protein